MANEIPEGWKPEPTDPQALIYQLGGRGALRVKNVRGWKFWQPRYVEVLLTKTEMIQLYQMIHKVMYRTGITMGDDDETGA